MTTQRELTSAARRLYKLLRARDLKVVFAESCTGGLVAATLTRIPGISHYLCGSAVVYQVETKAAWLGIPRKMLARADAVSSAVAKAMAENVLKNTPQAHIAASITGHLGPDAPAPIDGQIFIGIASRHSSQLRGRRRRRPAAPSQLRSPAPRTGRKR